MTVLVVAAHPDDEVLGSGGVMARHADDGQEVHVLILGEGATSRYADREAADGSQVEHLRDAAHEAHAILGVTSTTMLGLPDNRFDTVALLDIVKSVEQVVASTGARLIYTQHGGDTNVDHQLTFRAVLAATRPQPGHAVREVHSFAVASSTEWAFGQFAPRFRPTLFVDISDHLERKLAALEVYTSELRAYPHPRSHEHVRDLARVAGATVGVTAAEPFHTVRELR